MTESQTQILYFSAFLQKFLIKYLYSENHFMRLLTCFPTLLMNAVTLSERRYMCRLRSSRHFQQIVPFYLIIKVNRRYVDICVFAAFEDSRMLTSWIELRACKIKRSHWSKCPTPSTQRGRVRECKTMRCKSKRFFKVDDVWLLLINTAE